MWDVSRVTGMDNSEKRIPGREEGRGLSGMWGVAMAGWRVDKVQVYGHNTDRKVRAEVIDT